MLPDQVDTLFSIQFFVTLVMWPVLLIALIRRRDSTSARFLMVGLWLIASLVFCPAATIRLDVYHDKLVFMGIQSALDDQCGQGHAQAESGKFTLMSSYHWRWNGQAVNNFMTCDYQRGYTGWECSC